MNKYLCGLTLVATIAAVPAFADIVNNGQFKPGGSGNFQTVVAVDGTTIPGWTVTQGSVDWIGSYWQAPPPGGFSVDLDGLAVGAISQTINTNVNQGYVLSFWLAGNPDGPPDPKQMRLSVTGAVSQDYSAPKPPSVNNMGWTKYFFDFTATSTLTTITFTSLDTPSSNPYGPALGSVSVPEANFYAYVAALLGLSAVFLLLRRKHQA